MDGENGKKAIVYNMKEEKKKRGDREKKKKTKGKKREDKELSTHKS